MGSRDRFRSAEQDERELLIQFQSCRVSSVKHSQKRAEKEGSSPARYRWGRAPYSVMRKEAVPSRRSSVNTVVMEEGSAQKPCQSGMGELFSIWLRITLSTPKWQKRAIQS